MSLGPVLGIVGLAVLTVAFVFGLVAWIRKRIIAKLAADGLKKRSGSRRLHIKLHDFVGQGMRSGMRSIKPGELVLTGKGLYILCPFPIQVSGTDLSNLRVAHKDGTLELETDRPFEATGRVELSFVCEDAADWLSVLTSGGAVATSR